MVNLQLVTHKKWWLSWDIMRYFDIFWYIYMVGGWPTTLKNMSSSVGVTNFPTEWKKHVPNHQPDIDYRGFRTWGVQMESQLAQAPSLWHLSRNYPMQQWPRHGSEMYRLWYKFHGDFIVISSLISWWFHGDLPSGDDFPIQNLHVYSGTPMATFDYWTATKNTKRLQFARLGVGFEAAFQTMFIPINSACLKIGYRQIECFWQAFPPCLIA